MHKKIPVIIFLLVFTTILFWLPITVFSANEVSIVEDTTFSVSGSGIDFTVMAGSVFDSITIESTYITVTLSSGGSIELRSYERKLFTSAAANTDCSNASYSKLTLSGYSSATTITVTPSSDTCPSVSSSGGGGSGSSTSTTTTPTMPTSNTGSVTATASAGGKTTLTTTDNTTASIELPANAVTSSTVVSIVATNKENVITSRPVPSGKNVVGNQVYDFTAAAASVTVTNFSKDLVLTFTYTDSQVSGLNEDSLKVYYWDGANWTTLTSSVDKTNNKITASTNHFTYFVIMGELGTTMAKPEDYNLKEGDLIRAEGDFDIFIINQHGYKRLFLNPAIFNMYGHLGSWGNVITVTPQTRDAFITSNHYRHINEDKVYHMEASGEDTGTLQWINMTAENFLAQGGTGNGIFTINKSELDWYPKGADKTSL